MNRGETRPAPTRTPEPPITVDELLARLEHVRPAGANQWMARCPAHDDRVASLSVGVGRDKIVLSCHTGCEYDAITDALGVKPTQLYFDEFFPHPVKPSAPAERLPTPQELEAYRNALTSSERALGALQTLRSWSPATIELLGLGLDAKNRVTFPVHDNTGQLINVLRYLPGKRPDGVPKLMAARGRPRDLFPAPERFNTDEVWIVEGEPDAVAGHELGLTTIATPGTNGWRTTWASRFRGRVVVVCFDCDKPGREAAVKIANSLIDEAREVRMVDLDPWREDGFDLTDFVLAGGQVRDLLRLAAASSAVYSMRGAA